MILRFKQRFFSWFDSYDIYDENGNTVYVVKGQLSWGHCLKERIFTFLPKFEMYFKNQYVGCISREFALFKPRYNVECNGWHVEGNILEWDYTIVSGSGHDVARISKELFNWTDTYLLNINDPADALCVLMVVLAIDAEKCSRDNH